MNFRQQIAKFVTGNLETSDLPYVGLVGLEEGLDSTSLCILAGLSTKENPFQIEHYFKLALNELKIELPNKRQAALDYSIAIVDEILDGKRDVLEGTQEIKDKAIDSYDFISENNQYCYDSIHFELIFGLLDACDELTHADRAWQKGKSNEELLIEGKEQLINELKKWKIIIEKGSF